METARLTGQGRKVRALVVVLLLIASTSGYAATASTVYLLKITNATAFYGWQCEPKQSQWYEFWKEETKRDQEIEKYCKDNERGVYRDNFGAMIYYHGFAYFAVIPVNPIDQRTFPLYSSEAHGDGNSFNIGLDVNVPYWPNTLKVVEYRVEYRYAIYSRDPNGSKVLLKEGKASFPGDHTTNIGEPSIPTVYTNTYDMDSVNECIDGKVWVKKYGKMSGEKCTWQPIVNPEKGE